MPETDTRAALFLRMVELLQDIAIAPADPQQQEALLVGWSQIREEVAAQVVAIKMEEEA